MQVILIVTEKDTDMWEAGAAQRDSLQCGALRAGAQAFRLVLLALQLPK